MHHSSNLGLPYGAARDVTDGHVWHCTNKPPQSMAQTNTVNHISMWKYTVQTRCCVSISGNPQVSTIISIPDIYFLIYIVFLVTSQCIWTKQVVLCKVILSTDNSEWCHVNDNRTVKIKISNFQSLFLSITKKNLSMKISLLASAIQHAIHFSLNERRYGYQRKTNKTNKRKPLIVSSYWVCGAWKMWEFTVQEGSMER